jgi:acid phosphatase (class A)
MMKYRTLALGLALAWPAVAQAAMLDPASVDGSVTLPPPPAAGSPRAQAEVTELKAIHARSTPQMIAAAARDSKDEKPDMFNQALGFDLTALPQTTKLLTMVIEEEDVAAKTAKKFFHRSRPWVVDNSIETCTPKSPAKKSDNSYPSGHATLTFAMGEVLTALLPQQSQAILARSAQFAENRLVCGVHFRSDITAGQQFGTILALRLMQNPQFQAQMDAARAELRAAQH